MWCFCRKRSSIIEDEQSEEFVRIVCDKANNINDERTQLSNSIEKRRYNNQDESLANQNEFNAIYEVGRGKGKDYENSEICAKFISEVGNPKEVALLEKPSDSNLVPEVSVKLHKAEVHSFGKKENKLSINDGKETNKNKCNDSTKTQNTAESIETSFSNHFTQTENGVLPVPLMKRREKTKSTEMTDNPYSARNSNTPLDLSHKSVINSDGNAEKIFSKYKEQKEHQNKTSYHYENLPPGSENVICNTEISQKGLMLPLDLSLGSVSKCQDRNPGDSKLVDLHLELFPLNLSKKNLLSAEMAVSPPSFGRNCNGELSPMSMETSNTQCFSTASSRPDLLSNVDNDDYNFNDNSKISFFNGVYDKSSSSNVNLHAAHSGNCIGNDGYRIMSPSSLHNIKHYGSGSRDATKPQMAHSGSYVHPNIPSHHWQLQAKPLSFDRCNIPPSHQYLGSNNCLAHVRLPHNVVPCPNQAHLKGVISCSNSIHSLSNHSMNNSYYNPSYQNHTLDEEASYAVLDDIRKKPLYDNLESSEGNLYDIYDDKTKISNGPVYANMSPKAENLYFAYDNNTYIPPQRLKKIENTYENEVTSQVDHTYSTIGKSTHVASSESSHNNTVPAKATSPDIFFEVPEQNKTKISSNQSCSKPQMLCSESVPVALNLVKVPEIPLPVKVKSSSGGRNFLKHSKNTNNNGRNGKLTNSASKSGSKFGNKFKGKIKDITLVEASSSVMDELLSPSTTKQTPEDKQKKKKQSLTSLTSHQEATPEKMGPSLGACGKKFSSLSDMKKNSTSPISASNTPKPKGNRSGRSLLSSFSFRGDKKQSTSKKSDGSRLNKWSNSSAASLGSIASLASSSSSISNYVHPPSIASEGALLCNYRDEYDCGILIPLQHSTPPCLAANGNDLVLLENFKLLRECPWYWGALDVKGAEEMLSGREDGSFLVRDSSDEGCIVSLTFKSLQMTHHTRIEYKNGTLSFHIPVPCSSRVSPSSSPSPPPSPTTKSNIVEFMARAMEDSIQNCSNLSSSSNSCWLYLERSGPTGTSRVPVKLFSPISKRLNKERIPSLKWMVRKLIVGVTKKESISILPLSHWLKAYLLIEYIIEGPINLI